MHTVVNEWCAGSTITLEWQDMYEIMCAWTWENLLQLDFLALSLLSPCLLSPTGLYVMPDPIRSGISSLVDSCWGQPLVGSSLDLESRQFSWYNWTWCIGSLHSREGVMSGDHLQSSHFLYFSFTHGLLYSFFLFPPMVYSLLFSSLVYLGFHPFFSFEPLAYACCCLSLLSSSSYIVVLM